MILYYGPHKFLVSLRDDLPVVEVSQGLVRGQNWVSRSGRFYHSFRGLPYAKPPTGERRFRRTVSLDDSDRYNVSLLLIVVY